MPFPVDEKGRAAGFHRLADDFRAPAVGETFKGQGDEHSNPVSQTVLSHLFGKTVEQGSADHLEPVCFKKRCVFSDGWKIKSKAIGQAPPRKSGAQRMMYRFGAARPTELTDELSARFEGCETEESSAS